jgi:hypothetical protein
VRFMASQGGGEAAPGTAAAGCPLRHKRDLNARARQNVQGAEIGRRSAPCFASQQQQLPLLRCMLLLPGLVSWTSIQA